MYIHILLNEGEHKQVKNKCFKDNVSMSSYVRGLIEKDLHVELVPAAKKIKVGKPTPKVDAILEGRLNELLGKQDIVDVKDVRCKVKIPYDKLPPRMKQLIKDPDEYNEKAEVVTDRTV